MTVVLAPWQTSSSAVHLLRKLLETTAGWREVKAFAAIYTGSGGGVGGRIHKISLKGFSVERHQRFRRGS